MSSRTAVLGLMLAAGLTSCAKSPTSPAGSVTVTTPVLTTPANGATISNAAQPLTLTVANGLVTSGASASYSFEVATDAAFTSVTTTRESEQGSNGQTTATLPMLQAGRDYFWRVRTVSENTVGAYTTPLKFTIGPAITIQAPVPSQPPSGGAASQRPTFTVVNASRSGPAGAISYRFEIATSAAFSPIVASGTVPEGTNTTSFTPEADLPADATFFWRAQALDAANAVTGAFSTPTSFTTTLSIDLSRVNYQRFVNISAWPVTNQILDVSQDGADGHMCINHAKRGLLPTAPFEDDPLVPVEATQWYFARINGQWYGGAGEWLRPGQICKDGQKSEDIGKDGTWGGPMDTWIPKRGELVGYMISTPARAWPRWRTVDERSNVVVLPWVVNGISTP